MNGRNDAKSTIDVLSSLFGARHNLPACFQTTRVAKLRSSFPKLQFRRKLRLASSSPLCRRSIDLISDLPDPLPIEIDLE